MLDFRKSSEKSADFLQRNLQNFCTFWPSKIFRKICRKLAKICRKSVDFSGFYPNVRLQKKFRKICRKSAEKSAKIRYFLVRNNFQINLQKSLQFPQKTLQTQPQVHSADGYCHFLQTKFSAGVATKG